MLPQCSGILSNHPAGDLFAATPRPLWALAEAGRMSHPNNDRPVARRPRIEPMWEDLGLEEMTSEVSSSQRSEFSSTTVSEAQDMESAPTSSEGSEGGGSSSGFSTDVSTNPKRRRG